MTAKEKPSLNCMAWIELRRAEDGRVELTGLTRAAGVPFIPARVESLEL
jgi:hypothetical protein